MSAMAISALLDRIFAGAERINAEEMRRRAVLAELPPAFVKTIDELPEGLYGRAEAEQALSSGRGTEGKATEGRGTEGKATTEGRQTTEGKATDGQMTDGHQITDGQGIDPAELSEADLIREMESLGQTRAETIQHASWSALSRHTTRMIELENEYLRRHPERDIDERRTREGARR